MPKINDPHPLKPPHPGKVLLAYLGEHITMPEAAQKLGMTSFGLSMVLSELCDINDEMANKFGQALETGADFWLDVQAQYDRHHVLDESRKNWAKFVSMYEAAHSSTIRE